MFLLVLTCWKAYSSNVQFYSLNDRYGISIRETTEICADGQGFIWVSSKFGILRFTENDYRIYPLPYETTDIVRVQLTCKNAELYAYTSNGQIFKYNRVSDRFELLVNFKKVLDTRYISVNRILVDDENGLWIGSSQGLSLFKDGRLVKTWFPDRAVIALEWYRNSQLIFYLDDGIYSFDSLSKQERVIYKKTASDRFKVSRFYCDDQTNRIWVGTYSSGLFHLSSDSGSTKLTKINDFPKQPILAIEANSDSTMLIGIDGQGIWEIDKRSYRVVGTYKENADNPLSLSGNGVYDIFCDRNKRVWVCTYSGGVSFFEQANPIVDQIRHEINNLNSLINDDVNRVLEDREGKIWLATNNGISCWDVAQNRWKNYYHNKKEQAQVFLSMCEDDNGRIWAGTYSSGVYVIDSKTGNELAHYSASEKGLGFNSDFVFDLFKDSQGNMWCGGMQSNLICYQPATNRFKTYSILPVNVIDEYTPEKLVLGCSYGLVMLDKRSGVPEDLIVGSTICDLYVDRDVLWLGTSGDGLIRYDIKTKSKQQFTIESGLPSNFVKSIVYSEGYLWLGTENGLCRFDLEDNGVITYNSILSLSNISFNQGSHDVLSNGKLIFGTNKGAVMFDPETIQASGSPGKIFYQDLFLSGRSVKELSPSLLKSPLDSIDELRLKYNQNTFTLELLPLGVPAGDSRFSWYLEGLDQSWSLPAENRILTYTNIPSGDFVLKIRMYDSSLSGIIGERHIALHVIPPVWGRWWFKILAVIILLSVFGILFAYYINRLKKRHSEEKISFFTNTAHDIRTFLTLIIGPIEELHKETSLSHRGLYYLHLAKEQAQHLSAIVTQLMDFQKADVRKEKINLATVDVAELVHKRLLMFESFARLKDIKFVFHTSHSSYTTAIDEAMMIRVIDNLFSNAVKYSHEHGQIEVRLKCNPGKWMLEVRDQGIGIRKSAQRKLFNEFYREGNVVNSRVVGSGIGLLLVKNYVMLHDGTISYSSQENIGSVFKVTIPYKEVSESDQDYNQEHKTSAALYFPQPIFPQSEYQVAATAASRMSVLVVEDHHDLRDFLKSALGDQFDVLVADDGITAWDIIQKKLPDLVVSDVMMPGMDGFQLCQKIKSTYETSHIPVILLTALTGKAEEIKGLGLGADDYVTKPFDVTLLEQRIKSIIQNREAVRERALKLIKQNEDGPVWENEQNDKFVKKMIGIVRANISNAEFNKDDFASAMNVSSSLLYKKIKSLTGQSPTDFIKITRLNYAVELLQSRKYTVSDVSELCGFASANYFSTVFRKHFRKSPTELLD